MACSDELSEALDNRWNNPTYLMSSRLYRMQNKLRPIRPKPSNPPFYSLSPLLFLGPFGSRYVFRTDCPVVANQRIGAVSKFLIGSRACRGDKILQVKTVPDRAGLKRTTFSTYKSDNVAVRQFFSNSTYCETKKAKAQRERLVGLAGPVLPRHLQFSSREIQRVDFELL